MHLTFYRLIIALARGIQGSPRLLAVDVSANNLTHRSGVVISSFLSVRGIGMEWS